MTEIVCTEELFLRNTALIDVRAPSEFAKGSFPTAINLPLLNDDERHQIGITYKDQGQSAAIRLGERLVSGQVKVDRLEAWKSYIDSNNSAAMFCFRGGLRSQTSQQWLADLGVDIPIVRGGYKAMRRFLIDTSEAILATAPVIVLAGRTGSAKTALLKRIEGAGKMGCIDLEGLANHRGSAFGKRIEAQPSQIDFENNIAIELIRQTKAGATNLIFEDESRLIGRCALTPELQRVIQAAPVVMIEASLADRVNHSWENYILDNYQSHCSVASSPEKGFQAFSASLKESLGNISKRLGGKRYQDLSAKLDAALSAHEQGDNEQHKLWIEELLRDYYDPMYDYQQASKTRAIQFRGDYASALDFLNNQLD